MGTFLWISQKYARASADSRFQPFFAHYSLWQFAEGETIYFTSSLQEQNFNLLDKVVTVLNEASPPML